MISKAMLTPVSRRVAGTALSSAIALCLLSGCASQAPVQRPELSLDTPSNAYQIFSSSPEIPGQPLLAPLPEAGQQPLEPWTPQIP